MRCRPTASVRSSSPRSARAVGSKAKTPPPVETERFFFKQDGRGYLDDRTQQLFVVELATGKAVQVTAGARDHWHPAWSPDGQWIAYTAKDHGDADRTLNYDIFVVAPEGGTQRRISTSPGADGDPRLGIGARMVARFAQARLARGAEDKWIYYGSPQMVVADVADGTVARPARIDRWFYHPRWTPTAS